MIHHSLVSGIIAGDNYMSVWSYGKQNIKNDLTHYTSVHATYDEEEDCYRVVVRQEPCGRKNGKGAKTIEFICKRADLDGLLKIAKIKGGMEC